MLKKVKGSMMTGGIFFLVFIVFSSLILLNTAHAQTVRITFPNGGEVWTAGENKNITWTFSGVAADANVELVLLQGWKQIGVIASNIPIGSGGNGSWSWKVGQYQGGSLTSGSGYKIRMKIVGRDWVRDESDQTFSLVRASASTSGTTAKADSQPVKPKGYQQDPGTMPKATLERPPGETVDSSKLRGPMFNVEVLSVEIVGEGNRTKPFPNGGSITIEKGDVKDSIDIYHLYAVDIRYKLTNTRSQETKGKVSFIQEASKNTFSHWCISDERILEVPYHLKPGETKSFTKRFFMIACNSETHFKVLDLPGKELFQGNIVCSPTLLNWLGWPPRLRLDSERIFVISGQKVRMGCFINNSGGGPVKVNWSLTYRIIHPHAGIVFVKTWNYSEYPAKGMKDGPSAECTLPFGGDDYTLYFILESSHTIFLDDRNTGERSNRVEYRVQFRTE